MTRDDKLTTMEGCLVAILVTLAFALLFAFPTMWLWNWLMPSIFQLRIITFWEALGINFLCGILFRSPQNINK